MDNSQPMQDPSALSQAFQGQPQASAPQAGPGDPSHDAFVAMATGQQQQPSAPPIMQRGRIGPSSNPILNILGKLTGRGSFDYTAGPQEANQAPVSGTIANLTGVAAPQSYQPGGYLSSNDLGPQKAVGDTVLQNRAALMMQMFNMVDPTSATHILGAEKATPLIQASVARGFGGFIPKETLGAQQTAGQQDIEKNKGVASEIGKQGDVNARLGSLNSLIDNLEPLVKKNTPVPFLGGAAAKLVDASGGYGTAGMKTSAMVKNFGVPLTAALNYELTKRFNESEAAFIAQAVTPGPQDNPAYGTQKLNIARKLVSTMQSGNDDALSQVASQIMGKPVSVQSSSAAHGLNIGTVKKGYVYMGGPASDPNSWRKAGAQ